MGGNDKQTSEEKRGTCLKLRNAEAALNIDFNDTKQTISRRWLGAKSVMSGHEKNWIGRSSRRKKLSVRKRRLTQGPRWAVVARAQASEEKGSTPSVVEKG